MTQRSFNRHHHLPLSPTPFRAPIGMPRLAEELLALILDIVADSDDGNTLSQLALVNHQLLTLVRERRSAALIIGGPDFHCQPQKLHSYLQTLLSLILDDATFAKCIIALTLSHDADSAEAAVSNGLGSYSAVGWLVWSEVTDLISQILPRLPALRSLTITSHKPDAFIDWTHIPPELQDTLFYCFSLLSLDTLVLDRIVKVEITPLIDCSNITNLSLTGVTLSRDDLKPVGEAVFLDVDGVEGGRASARGHLQNLEVGDCGVALKKLLEGFEREDARLSVSNLRKLTVHASMYDDAMEKALKRLLRQASGSIEELRIRVPVSCDREDNELKVLNWLRRLERFSRLTYLGVEVVLGWCPFQHEHALQIPHALEPLEAIIQAIDHVCKEGQPGTVRLDFIIESHPRQTASRRTFHRQNVHPGDAVAAAMIQSSLWPLLDSAFSSVPNGTLSIDVAVITPIWAEPSAVELDMALLKGDVVAEKMYARMPNLAKNGILNVYCLSDQ